MQLKFCYNVNMENLWNAASIKIFKALDGQVRLVGGAVRDFLCRRPINDRDMATPLLPDEVEKKLTEAGIEFISIGKAHGTITAKIGGKPYEITTLRKDDKTDGRHAVVSWTTSYKNDACRRDFTINALSADIKGKIFDYTTGRSDLAQGLVRFIGDSEKRIQEDYLRILRYFRFWSTISSQPIDDKIVEICVQNQNGLEKLSNDRLRDEMYRIIITPRSEEVLKIMNKTGLLSKRILDITFSKKQKEQLKEMAIQKTLKKLGFKI